MLEVLREVLENLDLQSEASGALLRRPISFPVTREKRSWAVWPVLLLLISCVTVPPFGS